MLDQLRLVTTASPKAPAKMPFTLQRLWRQAQWGSAAAVALVVAVLAARSDVGEQRIADALSSFRSDQGASRTFDAEAATRQLVQAVRGLAADRDRLVTRIAAVEQNLDDMTGSVTRQIEAAKAAGSQALTPWPDDPASMPATTAAIASMLAPVEPADSPPSPLPGSLASATEPASPDAAESTAPIAYGADFGSASSIKTLQSRWTGLRTAHPQLFAGLRPSVTLRGGLRSKRTELRLVVGPFSNAEAAARLCASLAAFRQFCQPTMFDGRLALQ